MIAEMVLSLVVYFIPSLALARIFRRTGHRFFWQIASFLPFALAAFAYGMSYFLGDFEYTALILTSNWLFYIGLASHLSFKRWPIDHTPQQVAERFE